jgi:type III secretion protein Q
LPHAHDLLNGLCVLESPLKLLRLSGSEAHALTTLARHAVDLPLYAWPSLEPQSARLSLSWLPPDAPPVLDQPGVRMAVEWAGAALWLDWPNHAAERWLAGILGAAWPTWSTLAPEWQQVAQVQACAWLTQALGQSGQGSATCTAWVPDTNMPPVGVRHRLLMRMQVQVEQADVPEVFHGVLHTDSLGLLLLAGLVAENPGQASEVLDENALPQAMTLCLGETCLPLAAFEALRSGQVVLMQQHYMPDAHIHYLRTESIQAPWLGCQVRIDGALLHILSTVQSMTFPETPSVASVSDFPSDVLGQLPIRVSFDLGETILSLAQLKALQPGQTLALQRTAQEYVTIRANGMPIGTGQLVEIDGRLGVAVGSLTPAAQQSTVD